MSSTKARRAVAALGMVGLLVGGISGTARAAEDVAVQAEGQQFYAMHWNIAGATTHDGDPDRPNNYGRTVVVEQAAEFAETWRPAVISVNEACDSQVEELVEQLEDRGMEVHAVAFSGGTEREGPGPLPDQPHPACLFMGGYFPGVALISLVPASDPENLWFDPETNDIVRHRTTRAGACLTLHLQRHTRACTLHLAQDQETAVIQAQKFADHYRDQIAAYPFLLLGDLNATPDALRPSLYAPPVGNGLFWEADMDHPELGLPTAGNRKIDYAFGSAHAFDREQLALATIDPGTCRLENVWQPPPFVTYPHPCSDHRAVVATFTLLTGGGGGGGGGFPPQPPPLDLPPTVNAGPDTEGVEGGTVQLSGTATDREGTPAVRWSYVTPEFGAEPGVSCTFGDPTALSTTFRCTDDGTFFVSLTADDGVNPPVSDAVRVTLRNAPPVLRLEEPQPWQVYRAATQVSLRAPFTDAGANDTHTCTVSWDDGTVDTYPAEGGGCDRTHTFAHAGMYTVSTTVTDDDGAADTETVLVVVYDPEAGFVTGGGFVDTPAGKLHVQFNPKYRPGDESPAPTGGKVHARLAGDLRLDSTALEWLVVTPDRRIAVKGTATVNGQAGYGFVLYGYDAEPDALRLVIWPLSAGTYPTTTLTYDNSAGAGFDLDVAEPQSLAGGSITVHS